MKKNRIFALLLGCCLLFSSCGDEQAPFVGERELPPLPTSSAVAGEPSDEHQLPQEVEQTADSSLEEKSAEESGDISQEVETFPYFVGGKEEKNTYSGRWYQSRCLENGNFEAHWLRLSDQGQAELVVYSSELLGNRVAYQGNWIEEESSAIVIGLALRDEAEESEDFHSNFLWGRYGTALEENTLNLTWLEGDELCQGMKQEPVTWRKTEARSGYIKLEEYSEDQNTMAFSINDVDLVLPGDAKLMEKYNLPEDLDGCDFIIMDETEEYDRATAFQDDCTFSVVEREDGALNSRYTDGKRFCEALLDDQREKKSPRFVEYLVDGDGFLVSVHETELP